MRSSDNGKKLVGNFIWLLFSTEEVAPAVFLK